MNFLPSDSPLCDLAGLGFSSPYREKIPQSDGCESEWTPGVGDGQGGLVCCDSWGRKESDTTERLNWLKLLKSRIFVVFFWKMLSVFCCCCSHVCFFLRAFDPVKACSKGLIGWDRCLPKCGLSRLSTEYLGLQSSVSTPVGQNSMISQ